MSGANHAKVLADELDIVHAALLEMASDLDAGAYPPAQAARLAAQMLRALVADSLARTMRSLCQETDRANKEATASDAGTVATDGAGG